MIFQDVADTERDEPEALLQIIAPHQIPRLEFAVEKNKFVVKQDSQSNRLHGSAKDKAMIFRNR